MAYRAVQETGSKMQRLACCARAQASCPVGLAVVEGFTQGAVAAVAADWNICQAQREGLLR